MADDFTVSSAGETNRVAFLPHYISWVKQVYDSGHAQIMITQPLHEKVAADFKRLLVIALLNLQFAMAWAM